MPLLDLYKIWCKTDAAYPKDPCFYEKQCFQQEALLKDHEMKEDVFVDKVLALDLTIK